MALGLLAGPATNTAAAQSGPDLYAGIIDGPLWAPAGTPVHFETCVENQGDQGTGVFNIAWYVGGVRQGYGSHEGVPAKTRVCNGNSQFYWTAPNDPGGSRHIKWVVDEDNHVQESNEDNNSTSYSIEIY
ncbi:hypothetical protein ALI22I_07340 [Saccharothrix sp. ALI-22-I]|nr:hypothetical protein ALI22I_07340 [Saccharothrix sp. ALI-22-I]